MDDQSGQRLRPPPVPYHRANGQQPYWPGIEDWDSPAQPSAAREDVPWDRPEPETWLLPEEGDPPSGFPSPLEAEPGASAPSPAPGPTLRAAGQAPLAPWDMPTDATADTDLQDSDGPSWDRPQPDDWGAFAHFDDRPPEMLEEHAIPDRFADTPVVRAPEVIAPIPAVAAPAPVSHRHDPSATDPYDAMAPVVGDVVASARQPAWPAWNEPPAPAPSDPPFFDFWQDAAREQTAGRQTVPDPEPEVYADPEPAVYPDPGPGTQQESGTGSMPSVEPQPGISPLSLHPGLFTAQVTDYQPPAAPGEPANLVLRIELALVDNGTRLAPADSARRVGPDPQGSGEATDDDLTARHAESEPRQPWIQQPAPWNQPSQPPPAARSAQPPPAWPPRAAADGTDPERVAHWAIQPQQARAAPTSARTGVEGTPEFSEPGPAVRDPLAGLAPVQTVGAPSTPQPQTGLVSDQSDMWFLPAEAELVAGADPVSARAPSSRRSSLLTAVLTVGFAVLVVVLVLVFISLMTSLPI